MTYGIERDILKREGDDPVNISECEVSNLDSGSSRQDLQCTSERTNAKKSNRVLVQPPDSLPAFARILIGLRDIIPFFESIQFSKSPSGYICDRKLNAGGHPIFRVYPGLDCVVLTDHESGKFFFSAKSSTLDREDERRFGPLGVEHRFIGCQRPALLTNDKNGHTRVRGFTIAMIRKRADSVQASFDRAMDNAYDDLFERYNSIKNENPPTMYEAAIRIAGEFYFQWLLEMEAPPIADLLAYGKESVSAIQTDTWLSSRLATMSRMIQNMLNSNTDYIIAAGLLKVRSSPLYDMYLSLAKKHKLMVRDLDKLLLYTVNFNATFATYLLLGGVMGVLPTLLATLHELRCELDDHLLTINNIDSFELLDSFTWEAMRMFMRPTMLFKKAQYDLQIPAGDGKLYHVRKGKLVLAFVPEISRDESVFVDARYFNARRFLINPHLKKEVFNFGFVSDIQNKFGCAAHVTGLTQRLLKLFIGSLIQRADWSLDTQPQFEDDYLGEVGPPTIKFGRFTPR